MKKITTRLIQQFVGLLLIFATMIALFFGVLFAKQTEDLHQEEMTHRSQLISETLTDYFSSGTEMGQSGGMGGYGAFLRFLNQIAGEEVWVLDTQMNPIISSHHDSPSKQTDPPNEAKKLVTATFDAEKIQVAKKRNLFQLQELTIATPVMANDSVAAVVLMRSKVDVIHQNQISGYLMLLLSLVGAVIIASFLAWRLSKRFVKPIEMMQGYVNELANENYEETLAIQTKDELQQLGDQLTLLSQRLAEARSARDRKEQSEKDFLSQISHELRTPVMVIKSSLEAITDDYLSTREEKDYLLQLLKESTDLERLINDLLELSRLQSTEFHLQKELVDPLDCVNDALRSYRLVLKEKDQEIHLENQLNNPQMIHADYLRITQVIKILLDNATKYAPGHSTITVQIAARTAMLEIVVSNEWHDPIRNPEQLFESFQRQNRTNINGTGLGLAIAKQVIRRHEGQITAEVDGKQFLVKILLPSS
ncbi:HAMP domain-containing histidine kinase [Enterococcus raffinosus]|uniref:sensor histidine kinase n=1 Tax=Enterococcus raffinosus TaxID=71452 RepID=UPI001C11888D|nr:HAMP domain-containing sensor histidine kinase [Enterococcus raffinosus]MBU5361433.1 HAMP domain-containing histidine kinase [Enterococcus raffinosus]